MHNAHRFVKAKRTLNSCKMHSMKIDDENDLRPDAAKRLRLARRAAGFDTAKAAAERHAWIYETYQQHEKGTRGFGKVAPGYARAFRVTVGWLLHGEGRGPDTESVEAREGLSYKEIEDIEDQLDAIRHALIRQRLGQQS